ncbi:winged helix-turn-helix transcriptional regulator [Staphylococcus capitis]|uniref:ArsR/SmtB family transcription factor n=2 Tax=Staphylococcus TaxID=1279 RepID=UPI0008A4CE8C|nr:MULTISPECIES: metalloregulator ArsR/SmtB family transcription factor [Staphylococcus]MBC3080961.1 winged helix-turn-helix transcriptional regulator [Staphylococcus capitis]MCC9117539.1 metalloregulator ArsR/SmtB family transcription factor [Staphylococcus capitis]MCC9143991.1 metalloregulator ArsR/SmtB family transcription factor [Staphylococcus capitis]MDS3979203.1 metalloregulator ArsR/SmtB family transcription factor [Staphylococcus capitis]MDS3989102.1 metalloregulator ArsR/SmtB family 
MPPVKVDTSIMTEKELEYYEQIFNALADKIRLSILQTINQSEKKALCVCDLEESLELKQSKLSYHLKKLVDANILSAEKHGTWNYYKINEQQIQVVLNEDTCCKIL